MSDPWELQIKPGEGTKYFYKIEHTLIWAQMLFEREFCDEIKRAKEYMIDPGGFLFSVENRFDAVSYCNDQKFLDRQDWANSVNPGQTTPDLIKVYTVCHSFCSFWTCLSMVKPPC